MLKEKKKKEPSLDPRICFKDALLLPAPPDFVVKSTC